MRDNARNMDQTFKERAQNFQSLNAVENMQSYAEIAQRHARDVQRLVPAFQNLYNSLSDEQRRTRPTRCFGSYPGEESAALEGVSHKPPPSQWNTFFRLLGDDHIEQRFPGTCPAVKPRGADEHRHGRGPAGRTTTTARGWRTCRMAQHTRR